MKGQMSVPGAGAALVFGAAGGRTGRCGARRASGGSWSGLGCVGNACAAIVTTPRPCEWLFTSVNSRVMCARISAARMPFVGARAEHAPGARSPCVGRGRGRRSDRGACAAAMRERTGPASLCGRHDVATGAKTRAGRHRPSRGSRQSARARRIYLSRVQQQAGLEWKPRVTQAVRQKAALPFTRRDSSAL
jgi:hypothetical protein